MYSGLWMFAWDLADEGIDPVMGWAADSGLTALQIAGSYHAGWFIHPHNPRQRAYMTEDGSVYFQPTPSLYNLTMYLMASLLAVPGLVMLWWLGKKNITATSPQAAVT